MTVTRQAIPTIAGAIAALAMLAACEAPVGQQAAAPVASAPATNVETANPAPPAPPGNRYAGYWVTADETVERGNGWTKFRSGAFAADFPELPLPLFSDPEKQDVTTARVKSCTNGISNEAGTNWESITYYDPVGGASFDDLDTFCEWEDKEGVIVFARTKPLEIRALTVEILPEGSGINYVGKQVVSDAAPLTGPNGEVFLPFGPAGTEVHLMVRRSRTLRPADRFGRVELDPWHETLQEVWNYLPDSVENSASDEIQEP